MSQCPFCQDPECDLNPQGHLLACFDLTFDGEGELGVGLVSGSLNNEALGLYDLLKTLRQTRLSCLRVDLGQRGAVPPWVGQDAALSRYFHALGDRPGPGSVPDDPDEAEACLVQGTQDHPGQVRALLRSLVGRAGWDGTETKDEDPENPMRACSSYALWWDRDAVGVARAVEDLARKVMGSREGKAI